MTARRVTRKQTAEEKRKADMELTRNGILAIKNFVAKYPDDPFNAKRLNQMAMLENKLGGMTATA